MNSRHVMIMASAGSGKTYALTDRFVSLLAEGAEPEKIVALTFTRKAAGEFFDEIVRKLARAASDEKDAARLAEGIGRPELRPVDFLGLLRAVVQSMHRLRLGTLDSFFARIARAFAPELGLTGDFEILQEYAAHGERRRVFQRMFVRSPGGLGMAQRDFIEAFKRATFGVDEKRLATRLDEYIDEHFEIYLGAPAAEFWGNAAQIWPRGCEWRPLDQEALERANADLARLRDRSDLQPKQSARVDAFLSALSDWVSGGALPRPVEYLLKNAFAVWRELEQGDAQIVLERRRVALSSEECAVLVALVRHVVGTELQRRLEVTRGIHAVLQSYDAIHHEAVRRVGRLTFGDIQRLLSPEVSGRVLGEGGVSTDARLMIDYRLDGQFSHWLLDEFQDTSYIQWSVLQGLIDEVVQDPTGARSFFCVGDVKQAIYTWRGGTPELFREVFDHYNQAVPGAIDRRYLSDSWRSAPAVIEMVNGVFGRGDRLAQLFPGPASDNWRREWRDHVSARRELSGQAAWLHAEDKDDRMALTAQLVREIDPIGRGLECVVLTQKNSTATALAEYLRRETGMPAIAGSDLHVTTDNPLGVALMALVRVAAHPGDTLAWDLILMSPLGRVMEAEGIDGSPQLTVRVLRQIHDTGYEGTMEWWLRRIEPWLLPDDHFSRMRGRQFLSAAAQFDRMGSRGTADFLAFMERHVVADAEVSGVIKVMTIHKSKGLGFDVVVLPDLEGDSIDLPREGLAVRRAPDRSVAWILELPPSLFCERDAVLSEYLRDSGATACEEALSLFYVAMTRAKRGMYLISSRSAGSVSRNYPRILASTLGEQALRISVGGMKCTGGWSEGDSQWFEKVPRAIMAIEGESRVDTLVSSKQRVARPMVSHPSQSRKGVPDLTMLVPKAEQKATDHGVAVHQLLAEVEWSDDGSGHRWKGRTGIPEAAIAEAEACLDSPALAPIWRRVSGGTVWREKPFDLVVDGVWISGIFDRVVIERDSDGTATAARVYDFKSEVVRTRAEIEERLRLHAEQLLTYRRAARALSGLPLAKVSCEVVFTSVQERFIIAVR